MNKHVAGISLESLEEPIYDALGVYSHETDGEVLFDSARALRLQPTPEKPNSARSQTRVLHQGEYVGDLFVIAFKPGDGTGDENTHPLLALDTGNYPRISGVVPRSKRAAHSEVHLALAAAHIDQPNADPILYAGNLKLLGLQDQAIVKLGELGQSDSEFANIISGADPAEPTTTFTVGYLSIQRFGDPHAVYNPEVGIHNELVQICGFVALSPEMARHHMNMLYQLGGIEPHSLAQ